MIRERCHYCSRFRQPLQIVRMSGGAAMCWHCYEWHLHALDLLAGAMPRGCQICGDDWQKIEARPGYQSRTYLHMKDGLYQVACKPCSDAYVLKRRDWCGQTLFGRKMRL